jgi:hypothetical protein
MIRKVSSKQPVTHSARFESVEGDLERFKEFIENRGQETGAWRGTIRNNADRLHEFCSPKILQRKLWKLGHMPGAPGGACLEHCPQQNLLIVPEPTSFEPIGLSDV